LEQSNQVTDRYYDHEQKDDELNPACTTNSSTTNNISELQITNNDNFSESDKLEYSETAPISNDILHKIKLLKIINDIGTPLYAYKEIMEWAKDAYLSDYKFGSGQKSYKQTIKFLQQKLNFQKCQPTKLTVELYQDKMKIDVVVFDVRQMLLSLLNNSELNQSQNLVVNKNDRFAKYEPPDGQYGEINSGTWYDTAYANCIENPNTDFLCPLVLASDKTSLSEMGDLHIDAIFLTTSLFNTHVSEKIKVNLLIPSSQKLLDT